MRSEHPLENTIDTTLSGKNNTQQRVSYTNRETTPQSQWGSMSGECRGVYIISVLRIAYCLGSVQDVRKSACVSLQL